MTSAIFAVTDYAIHVLNGWHEQYEHIVLLESRVQKTTQIQLLQRQRWVGICPPNWLLEHFSDRDFEGDPRPGAGVE